MAGQCIGNINGRVNIILLHYMGFYTEHACNSFVLSMCLLKLVKSINKTPKLKNLEKLLIQMQRMFSMHVSARWVLVYVLLHSVQAHWEF